VIAGYVEVDGRLVPIVVEPTAITARVVRSTWAARRFGIAFGNTFLIGSVDQLGGMVARNLADAYRPVP
jgi:hypothetical protein